MSKRILVVEDQEDNRRIVRDLLTSVGYEVIEAVTGDEGVKMAGAHTPDLILMDIQLPVMDGYEATRRIKADPALFTGTKGERPEPLGVAFHNKADTAFWLHRAYPELTLWPPPQPKSAAEVKEKVWYPDAPAGDGTGIGGTDHPISWCRDYDGGRSFYTAGGHTQESYAETSFIDHLGRAILWAAGAI